MKQRKLVTTKRITKYRNPKTGKFIRKAHAKRWKYKGEYYQETRMKGVIVKAPRWKPVTYMYRTTLAINYPWHRKYFSLKITVYAKHKKDLPSEKDLEEILLREFQNRRGKYSFEELVEAGQQIRIGYEKPTKIKEDKKLIGETVVSDEKLRDAKDKGSAGILKMIWKRIVG